MSKAFTSAGTTLGVSATAPATYDQAGFELLTFTEVGEITDLGEYGRQYNLVTHNPLGDRRTVKRKGSYNDGALSMQLARVPDDTGQVILINALDTDDSIACEITLQNGDIQYFTAQVMSYTTGVGSVDQITNAACNLEIDNDIIEVAAP